MKGRPEIGDIFCADYGKSAVDFYQIMELKPKTVIIQKIAFTAIYDNYEDGYPALRPIKDAFTGEQPIMARVRFDSRGYWTGEIASGKLYKQQPSGGGVAKIYEKDFLEIKVPDFKLGFSAVSTKYAGSWRILNGQSLKAT